MNLRELINTLDTIENKVDETVVKSTTTINEDIELTPFSIEDESIARHLVESFGYKYLTEKPAMVNSPSYTSNYDSIFRNATSGASGGEAVKAAAVAGKEAGYFAKFGGPLLWAYTIYAECKDAYEQIKALPKDLEPNQQHAEVTKIVGHIVTRFGLFWVGMILGGMVGTAAFPGAGTLVGMIFGAVGGWSMEHFVGNSTDELVNWIVNKMFGTKNIAKPAQAAQANSKKDPEIESLQKRLVAAGAVNTVGPKKGQPLDVDGIWGPNTAAAYEEFKKNGGTHVEPDDDEEDDTEDDLDVNPK
jgi:hypothetical protein